MTNWLRSALDTRIVVLAAALALIAAGCGSSSSGPAGDGASFEDAPCPESVADLPALANARCGYLAVPENRTVAHGPMIRMPVAIIPSVIQPPTHEPIFHLTGGPGGDALTEAQYLMPAGLNQNRDLIIMEQRGTLDAQPELLCPEIDAFNTTLPGLVYDAPSTGVAHVAATKACHDRLVAAGIDLSAYNTSENATDFVDLRRVLKINQWSIYSTSYGTYLALTLMRLHPEGLRSVVLDSVSPPSVVTFGYTWSNLAEAFNNLFAACAAQTTCASKYGDLSAKFTTRCSSSNPIR